MKRTERRKKRYSENGRYLFFIVAALLCFAYIGYGAYDLQVSKGQEYADEAGVSGVKTISVKGLRGMITDRNSVILARSEMIYNVTFQRTNSENTESDYRAFTRSILDTIDILESYGVSINATTPLQFNEETGLWEMNFGSGISESATAARETLYRKNNYITNTEKYPDAESIYLKMCERYYLVEYTDAEGKVIAPVERNLDRDTTLKVIAVYNKMQENLFNSLPIVIATDVPFAAVSEIEGRSMALRGMGVQVGEKRVYPHGSLAASIIGYTGAIQNYEYFLSDLKPQGYALSDHIGQAGVEESMESWLTACISERQGSRVVEKDNTGKITRELSYQEPSDGNNVKLTIDVNYQQAAERAIADNVNAIRDEQELKMTNGEWLEQNRESIDYRNWEKYPIKLAETGMLLVMDVDNGDLLASAQYPSYDLNAMIAGGKAAQEVNTDTRNLTSHLAIQGRYEPGSIFKMVTGLAALTNHEVTGFTTSTKISDGGRFMAYTKNEEDAPKCWTNYPQSHQDQTIVEGLSNSCNYFFYTLGSMLYGTGADGLSEQQLLYKYAAQIGLTSKTGIQLPQEGRSIVGNQQNMYDPTVPLDEQVTLLPTIVANSIKKLISEFGAGYGIEYDTARLDKTIKLLMDMAIESNSDDWVANARPILMSELNMTRDMVMKAALMSNLWVALNNIKWGGSQEIQMAIGQSITLLTPMAVVRYVGALAEGNVWNVNIIDSIISPEGEVLTQYAPSLFGTLEDSIQYLPKIQEGMRGVVDESGTATRYFRDWKYDADVWIMGKTGTSQVTEGGVKIDLENNAWFVCLAPQEDPKIAVVSCVPHGYAGAQATRAVRDFVGWYLDETNKVVENLELPAGNQLAP
ncbi:MAG: hypothetical protein E7326_01550 [Clostridiales bacterium]|nr:hypothetical protein [Clostridiales bacterium]